MRPATTRHRITHLRRLQDLWTNGRSLCARSAPINSYDPSCRSLAAIGLATFLAFLPTAADAITLPTFSLGRNDCVNVAGLCWHTDYENARREAKAAKKMLLVNFVADGGSSDQRSFEKYLHENEAIRKELGDYVLVRVPENERRGALRLGLLRKSRGRLLDDPAYKYMTKTPGVAIVDFKHANQEFSGRVVTALPFKNGKYYRWTNSHLAVALDLPGRHDHPADHGLGRPHPSEAPRSTDGKMHAALAAAPRSIRPTRPRSACRATTMGIARASPRLADACRRSERSRRRELAEPGPDRFLHRLRAELATLVRPLERRQRHAHLLRLRHPQRPNGIWYGTGIFAN